MVDTPPPAGALWVGHWHTFGGEKTREYVIAERCVGDTGDTSAQLCGEQHLDGSTKRCWITVGGDDPHLTVEQARGLATALHELAAMLNPPAATHERPLTAVNDTVRALVIEQLGATGEQS